MGITISEVQLEAIKSRCRHCGNNLEVVGDLSDTAHDIVMCSNGECGFTMFYDGSVLM